MGFIEDQFFSLVLILRIPAYLGIKGDWFFSDDFIFWSFYIQIGVLQFVSRVWFLREIERNKFVCNKFVSNLVQINLIQFEYTNCIRSICNKTNTNWLHTNWIHSILSKIGHLIQIVVHQFVPKTSAEKKSKSEKIGPPWSPGMQEYIESVLRRKKLSTINPTYVENR